MRMSTLRVLILGDGKVGKSGGERNNTNAELKFSWSVVAVEQFQTHITVTVRFLTKRFIGEYFSNIDLLYRTSVRQEENLIDVEVLDTCSKNSNGNLEESRVNWADAFVIVYSICNRRSFHSARGLVDSINKMRTTSYVPILLLGNMTDLEHRREVGVEEGHEVALEYGCQYYEVSAAESSLSINIAFQAFMREAKIVQQQRATLLKRRRSSLGSVSKKLGAMFGKNNSSKDSSDSDKRRMSVEGAEKKS